MPQTPWPALIPAEDLAGRPPLPLARPVTLVGSRHTANIRISSSTISKAHALILNSEGSIYIRDLGSRTGVVVNDTPVRECSLRDGDVVRLGRFTFRFSAGPANLLSRRRRTPVAAILELQDGAQLSLAQRVVLVGQRDTSDLVIPDDQVSTAHAVLFDLNGRRYVFDLGSRSGTFVNNHQVQQSELKPGDKLRVGSATLIYRAAAAPAEQPVKPKAPKIAPVEEPAPARGAQRVVPAADAELDKLFAEMAAIAPATTEPESEPELKLEEPEPLKLEEPAPLPAEEAPAPVAHAEPPLELAEPPVPPVQVATASVIQPEPEPELSITPPVDEVHQATAAPEPVRPAEDIAPEPEPEPVAEAPVEPEPIDRIVPVAESLPEPEPLTPEAAEPAPTIEHEPAAEVEPEPLAETPIEPESLPEPINEPALESVLEESAAEVAPVIAPEPEILSEPEPPAESVAEHFPEPDPVAQAPAEPQPLSEPVPAAFTEPEVAEPVPTDEIAPADEAAPGPTVEPLPEPPAEPEIAESASEPLAEPIADLAPEPVVELAPEPVSEVMSEPVAEAPAEVEPVAEAPPLPIAEAPVEFEPLADALPEIAPVAEVAAEPIAQLPEPKPIAEPVVDIAPEPIAEAPVEPEPLAEASPEPASEVTPEPLPEPIAEVAPEPIVAPVALTPVEPIADAWAEPEPEVADLAPEPEPGTPNVELEPPAEPVAEVMPEPEFPADFAPEPVAATAPEPPLAPVADLLPEPLMEPVADIAPEPEPLDEFMPEPVADASPEPPGEMDSEPLFEAAAPSVAEASPEPLLEPIAQTPTEPDWSPEPAPELQTIPNFEPEPVADLVPDPQSVPIEPAALDPNWALSLMKLVPQLAEVNRPEPDQQPPESSAIEPQAPAEVTTTVPEAVLAPSIESTAVEMTPIQLPAEQLAQFDDIPDESPLALNPNDSLAGMQVIPAPTEPLLAQFAEPVSLAPVTLGDHEVLALFDDEEAPATADDPNNASYAGEYVPGVSPEPLLATPNEPAPPAIEPPAFESLATASAQLLPESAVQTIELEPAAPAAEPVEPVTPNTLSSTEAHGIEEQVAVAPAPPASPETAVSAQQSVLEPSTVPAPVAPASATMPAPAGPLHVRFFGASETMEEQPGLVPMTLSNSSGAIQTPKPPPAAPPRRPGVQFISAAASQPVALTLPVMVPPGTRLNNDPPAAAASPVVPPPAPSQPVAPAPSAAAASPFPVAAVPPPPIAEKTAPPPAPLAQAWNTGGIRPPGTGPLRTSHRRGNVLDDVFTGTASGTSDDIHLSATPPPDDDFGAATGSAALVDDIFALNAPTIDDLSQAPAAPEPLAEPSKDSHRSPRAARGPIIPPKVGAWGAPAELAPPPPARSEPHRTPRIEPDLDQVLGALPEPDATQRPVIETIDIKGKQTPSQKPRATRSRRRGVLILLVVVLLMTVLAAGVVWLLKLQNTLSQGAIVYDALETLDPKERVAFEQAQAKLLEDADLRKAADLAAPLQLSSPRIPLLPPPTPQRRLRHEFVADAKARTLKVTLEGNDPASDTHWLNALLIAVYEHQTNRAMRDKSAEQATARAELRGQIAARRRELAEESRRLDALRDDLKKRPAPADIEQAKAAWDLSTNALGDLRQQLRALLAEERKLKEASSAANVPPAPRDDARLKDLSEQLASLQSAMTRTREEASRKSEEARKTMDQALDQLQGAIGNAQGLMKDNPALADYIAGAQSLSDAAREFQRQLLAVQERQQQQLQSISTTLREQSQKRRKELIDNDEDLRGLEGVLSVRLRDLANAQSAGLSQEVARLNREIELCRANIAARREELAIDPYDQAGLQAVQAIIDANNKHIEADRAKSETLLKEREAAFRKTAPKIQGLPKAQQELATQLAGRVDAMEAARKSYNQAIATQEAAASELLKKQQADIDALQKQMAARRQELADEQRHSQGQSDQLTAIQKQIQEQKKKESAAIVQQIQALSRYKEVELAAMRAEAADAQSSTISANINTLRQAIATLSTADVPAATVVVARTPVIQNLGVTDQRSLYISAILLAGFVVSATVFLLSGLRKSEPSERESGSAELEVGLTDSEAPALSQN